MFFYIFAVAPYFILSFSFFIPHVKLSTIPPLKCWHLQLELHCSRKASGRWVWILLPEPGRGVEGDGGHQAGPRCCPKAPGMWFLKQGVSQPCSSFLLLLQQVLIVYHVLEKCLLWSTTPDIERSPYTIITFLLMSGYLSCLRNFQSASLLLYWSNTPKTKYVKLCLCWTMGKNKWYFRWFRA